jgi:hypothetical protein
MGARADMGIIGLIGMGEHAVGQRRVDRRGDEIRAGNLGLIAAAQGADIFDRRLPRPEARARNHGRQGVDQMVPGLGHDLRRQLLPKGGGDVAAKLARDPRPFGLTSAHPVLPLQARPCHARRAVKGRSRLCASR